MSNEGTKELFLMSSNFINQINNICNNYSLDILDVLLFPKRYLAIRPVTHENDQVIIEQIISCFENWSLTEKRTEFKNTMQKHIPL